MYRKNNKGWIKHIDFELIDIICIELAFLLAYYLRHKEYIFYKFEMYQRLCIMIVLFDLVVVFFTKNYNGIVQRGAIREMWFVIQHVTIINGILLVYEFIIKEADILSRFVLLTSWGIGVALCFIARCSWKQVIRKWITSEKHQASMIVISEDGRINKSIQSLYGKPYREYKISNIFVLNANQIREEVPAEIPVTFGRDNLLEYVRTKIVDQVYIDTFSEKNELNELTDVFLSMGITVHIGMGFLPEDLPNQFMEKFGESHAITTSIKTAREWELAAKRIMDIIGALVGLILCGVAYVFVAPAIKKASPGPVFFCTGSSWKKWKNF